MLEAAGLEAAGLEAPVFGEKAVLVPGPWAPPEELTEALRPTTESLEPTTEIEQHEFRPEATSPNRDSDLRELVSVALDNRRGPATFWSWLIFAALVWFGYSIGRTWALPNRRLLSARVREPTETHAHASLRRVRPESMAR